MSLTSNRRSFIQRLGIGLSAAFVAGRANFAFGNNHEKKKAMAIKNLKPLGFVWETQDPFLFCVHHEDHFPEGNENMGPDPSYLKGRNIGQDFMIKDGFRMYHGSVVPGFPGHPHRGFETITVVNKGMVDHTDSMGGAGRYGGGDIQWMTAGKGIQHAEMFPLIHKDKKNPMELFQIWLNLPKANKFAQPHYKMLWSENVPKYTHTDAGGNKTQVTVIAGQLEGHTPQSPPPNSWAADPKNEVAIWNISMEAGATWVLPQVTQGVNRSIYFYEGSLLKTNGVSLAHYHSAELDSEAPITIENGNEPAKILILQGRPINEPVVQHGPFVMNSKDEIRQAFDDYQKDNFGGWPWDNHYPVHDRSQGRFALHADGKREEKG